MKVASVLVFLILVPPAIAQIIEPWSANRELRMKEASRLATLLSAMDKQVPVLSPAEQQWLDGEMNSGNGRITERVLRAMDSKEWEMSTAKLHFALLIPALHRLSAASMGQRSVLSCKDEVLLWTKVASMLPDGELWQSVDSLVKRKLVSKRSAEDLGHSFLAGNATLRSQAILNGVVIPYLEGGLSCP